MHCPQCVGATMAHSRSGIFKYKIRLLLHEFVTSLQIQQTFSYIRCLECHLHLIQQGDLHSLETLMVLTVAPLIAIIQLLQPCMDPKVFKSHGSIGLSI